MEKMNLSSTSTITALFNEKGITDFSSACAYVRQLPYGRNANRSDFSLVLTEGQGSCSSKHALLATLALENEWKEVELIVGIFLMSAETHPSLTTFFKDKPYTAFPEAHCYLRFKGERYDFTDTSDPMQRIASKIVREQRVDPNQVVDWKPMIHRHYMEGWLKRNPEIPRTIDELWSEREEAIAVLSGEAKTK